MSGKQHPLWKNARWENVDGYICKTINGHQVYEHRYLMEQHLKRKLNRNELVHHKDGNKSNNNLHNLEVMNISKHNKHHRNPLNKWCGKYDVCVKCKTAKHAHKGKGLCNSCYSKKWKIEHNYYPYVNLTPEHKTLLLSAD
jgi:hypothetical protein